MKLFLVLLKESKDAEYLEADSWAADKGVVTVLRGDFPVAAFPFDNLLGIIDLSEGSRLTQDEIQERLKERVAREAKARGLLV